MLGKRVRFPALGNPVLDDLVGKLRISARGPADEAVERAANLMRHGDRRLARETPEITLSASE
jgi:hypothetical protein